MPVSALGKTPTRGYATPILMTLTCRLVLPGMRQAMLSSRRAVYDWRSVLTVAHLDRNPGNNAPDNLKALCVVCHLNYDRAEHIARSKRTWALKRAGPTILLPL